MKKIFSAAKNYIIYGIVFTLPLLFLPITQEFFATNKLFFLAFGVLILLLLSTAEFVIERKIIWKKTPLDTGLILIIIASSLSLLFSSPNKIQAVFNLNFGYLMIVSLVVLSFYLLRNFDSQNKTTLFNLLNLSGIILAFLTIILFFQPFKNINLPQYWQFLKNPLFSPVGSPADLGVFLGFLLVLNLASLLTKAQKNDSGISSYLSLILAFISLILTLFTIFKPAQNTLLQLQQNLALPPFRLGWYGAVETLKNPLTAVFGVGIDNYASIFTRVKDLEYNQSSLWQINSFSLSRSTILHIFSEAGLFGVLTLIFIVYSTLKNLFGKKDDLWEKLKTHLPIAYTIVVLLLFPPSLMIFFLFFYALSIADINTSVEEKSHHSFDFSSLLPFYLTFALFCVSFIAASFILLGRAYLAEYYFKKSFDSFVKNDGKGLYDNQRQTVILNPYLEKYRISFAQTNMLIANNIASKAQSSKNPQSPLPPEASAKGGLPAEASAKAGQQSQLSDSDRQTIAQAIQAAIAEAKAAVQLNPQKATNWDSLATIYRNILGVAQGADAWTVSAYQRAIILDPQNPLYRLNLGGVYYQLANYDEASKLFEQTVGLKPDWSNGHYNLAWASFRKKDYQKAVAEMQNALSLLDAKRNKDDYKKAQSELEEFKKKLPAESQNAASASAGQNQQTLTLPSPPEKSIEPKIELPAKSSP